MAANVNHMDTNKESDETADVYNPRAENEQATLRMNYTPMDKIGFDVCIPIRIKVESRLI